MKLHSVFIILMSVSLCVACHQEKHEEKIESTFIVTSPIQQDIEIFKNYVCQIHSSQRIELRALEKGYLQKIYVDEGKPVKKGQILFQIVPTVYQAEVQKARAEVDFASIELANTKSLADSSIVSSTELALIKAKKDKADADLALAEARLAFTEIRAPFDGMMGRLEVRLGSLLDEGELLSTLSDNSKMWVYFNVGEVEYLDYITGAQKDEPRAIKLELANKKLFSHTGVLETIQADFNQENGNIAFRAAFPNSDGILRHGETGLAQLPLKISGALLIPQKATFEILDKKYVYVVAEDNTIQAREISTSYEMPHVFVVTEGLSSKDKILVDGLRKVKNNQKIKYDFVDQHKVLAELDQLRAE